MISFVTAVKLMPGYEDYQKRLEMYVESIAAHSRVEYEIIVVEDQSGANLRLLRDCFPLEWWAAKGARLIEYEAVYPNPHGYNMIEAYAKNVGLRAARFPYVCVTNCDVLFNAAFFELCASGLQSNVFYRFLEYETPAVAAWELAGIEASFGDAVCINPDLADPHKWSLKTIAFKSGDAMLLDRRSWEKVEGFPENEVWVHSDLIVCTVVNNNRIPLHVPTEAKVYTYPQDRALVEKPFELAKSYEYLERVACN